MMRYILILALFATILTAQSVTLNLNPTQVDITVNDEKVAREDIFDGTYRLEEEVGRHKVTIEAIGFKTKTLNLEIYPDDDRIENISLEHQKIFSVHIRLQKDSGLIVDCALSDTCLIDGVKVPSITQVLEGGDNIHQILVKSKDFYDYEEDILINSHKNILVELSKQKVQLGIGLIGSNYFGKIANLVSENDKDKFIKYEIEDTSLIGVNIFFRKSFLGDFIFGFEGGYLTNEETYAEDNRLDLTKPRNDGIPSLQRYFVNASAGYGITAKQTIEFIYQLNNEQITRSYADDTFTLKESYSSMGIQYFIELSKKYGLGFQYHDSGIAVAKISYLFNL